MKHNAIGTAEFESLRGYDLLVIKMSDEGSLPQIIAKILFLLSHLMMESPTAPDSILHSPYSFISLSLKLLDKHGSDEDFSEKVGNQFYADFDLKIYFFVLQYLLIPKAAERQPMITQEREALYASFSKACDVFGSEFMEQEDVERLTSLLT